MFSKCITYPLFGKVVVLGGAPMHLSNGQTSHSPLLFTFLMGLISDGLDASRTMSNIDKSGQVGK